MSRKKKALRPLDVHVQQVLAEAVRQSGKSHASIGQEVGLSQNRASTILRGDTPPATLGEMAVIAQAVGVTGTQVLEVAEERLEREETAAERDGWRWAAHDPGTDPEAEADSFGAL